MGTKAAAEPIRAAVIANFMVVGGGGGQRDEEVYDVVARQIDENGRVTR